jgi:hypothetical protein
MAQMMNKDIFGVFGWTRRKLSGDAGGGSSSQNVPRKSTMESFMGRSDQRVQA